MAILILYKNKPPSVEIEWGLLLSVRIMLLNYAFSPSIDTFRYPGGVLTVQGRRGAKQGSPSFNFSVFCSSKTLDGKIRELKFLLFHIDYCFNK